MNKYIVAIVPIGKVIAANQDADKVDKSKISKTRVKEVIQDEVK